MMKLVSAPYVNGHSLTAFMFKPSTDCIHFRTVAGSCGKCIETNARCAYLPAGRGGLETRREDVYDGLCPRLLLARIAGCKMHAAVRRHGSAKRKKRAAVPFFHVARST